MFNRFKHKNFWVIFFLDICVLTLMFISANLIRFDFHIPAKNLSIAIYTYPYLIVTKICCLFAFDLYSGMWRFASIRELLNVVKASFTSFSIVIIFFFIAHRFLGFSRTVLFIDFFLMIFAIGGIRLFVRFYFEYSDKYKTKSYIEKKKTIIIGAGEAGEKLYREIQKNPILNYRVVGFIDDNLSKIGRKIHGVSVLATINELSKVIQKTNAEEVIIAIPSTSDTKKIKKIVNICKENKIRFQTLPSTFDILNSDIKLSSLRKVSYKDLLGRDEIHLDSEKIYKILKNKNILVTGAGGSIGSELCKQISTFNPKKIILFEIAETPLYEIDITLKNTFPHINIIPIVGDIKDKYHIEKTIKEFKINILFHAAAYKHVPMMEAHPCKAVENNIQGTKTLLDASLKCELEKFVLISTDKAVNPTSVMGATKKITEILLQKTSHKSTKTKYIAVRFGNVLGSSGSVIPLFEKQIKKGGPITVTHPDITRYFMTIPEACILIIQATSMGKGGEIFILDMGKPVKIIELAKEMIKFYDTPYKKDVEIKVIGLRDGEKLYEELYADKEKIIPTTHKKIMLTKPEVFENNDKEINDLIKFAKKQTPTEIKQKIKQIVKEYSFSN